MTYFSMTVRFGSDVLPLEGVKAETPLQAIQAAKARDGIKVAQELGCLPEELTWEAEEDFLDCL